MKSIILLVFLFVTYILPAQDDVYSPSSIKGHIPRNSYNQDFIASMDLTDSATAILYGKHGDTMKVIIKYSHTATLEKMQAFVCVYYGRDSIKIYNPMELKGYRVFIGSDSFNFITVDNQLNIVSLFTTPLATWKKQKLVVNSKVVFMNCLVDGPMRLYRYTSAKKSPTSYQKGVGATLNTDNIATRNDGDETDRFIRGKIMYCIQKSDARLTPVTADNLPDLLSDCAETRIDVSKETIKDEIKLRKVFTLYNQWKVNASASPDRY